MSGTYRSLKGTKDILPGEVEIWQFVEKVVHDVMRAYHYGEIRTPALEATGLFARSIGEHTDIVGKEMYTFVDRGGDSVTLKPEGTAAVLRAFVQHNLGEQSGLNKLYYISPMFRQERPQAGRLRQFHQFGAEAIGSASPALDVESMLIPLEVSRRLGIDGLTLKLSSVGCEKCRPPYRELLIDALEKVASQLSEESRARLRQNPMRILDSKDDRDQRLTAHVPLIKDHLCAECREHFEQVQQHLRSLDQPYVVDGRLVRGLDYYTKTAFEITSASLGAQDALAGGGRYDLLAEELGGAPTPGVGFAAGIERLILVLSKKKLSTPAEVHPTVFLVAMDDASRRWAFRQAILLRSEGVVAELDYLGRSVRAQMREANRQQAGYVLVIGERELETGNASLKNMETGKEISIVLEDLSAALLSHGEKEKS